MDLVTSKSLLKLSARDKRMLNLLLRDCPESSLTEFGTLGGNHMRRLALEVRLSFLQPYQGARGDPKGAQVGTPAFLRALDPSWHRC